MPSKPIHHDAAHEKAARYQRTYHAKRKRKLAELEMLREENAQLRERVTLLEGEIAADLAARSGTATFTERSAAAQN